MFDFLRNPHGFGMAIAVVTAVLSYLYARTTETDKHVQQKTFWKTLVVGIIASLLVVWTSSSASRPDAIVTEPFNIEP